MCLSSLSVLIWTQHWWGAKQARRVFFEEVISAWFHWTLATGIKSLDIFCPATATKRSFVIMDNMIPYLQVLLWGSAAAVSHWLALDPRNFGVSVCGGPTSGKCVQLCGRQWAVSPPRSKRINRQFITLLLSWRRPTMQSATGALEVMTWGPCVGVCLVLYKAKQSRWRSNLSFTHDCFAIS